MKKITLRNAILQVAFLTIGTTALVVLPVMAQEPPATAPQDQAGPQHGGRGGPGRQVEFLTKKLNLTPDQVTQVKAIDADAQSQSKAVREDTSVAGPDKRAKMMDIRKASNDKIRALLTPDQQTKFDTLQTEMRGRRGNRGDGQGPPPTTPQQ
jgi:Spy/CpxP family protein refolding chaperone